MYHEMSQMSQGMPDFWNNLLREGLTEDGCQWDWTALGTQKRKNQKLRARVIAKSEGIWAAEGLVHALMSFSPDLHAESKVSEGQKFKSGDWLVSLAGFAHEIFALERPFLNLAAYASGIATATAKVVDQVKQVCPIETPRVTLTRKTLPGYRDLSIHSVRVGGGYPHRVSLSGGVLIKENHISAAGSIAQAIHGAQNVAPHGLKIQVEVRNLKELQEAEEAGAEGLLLDNFTPDLVKAALTFLKSKRNRVTVEVSGGITHTNIAAYAQAGVHVLSLGSLTHSVQAADFSLLVDAE